MLEPFLIFCVIPLASMVVLAAMATLANYLEWRNRQ